MKKKLLLLALLSLAINVKAISTGSEYKFIGYSQDPLESSENYKYEEVHLHKYYTIGEVNTIYAPFENTFESSPYIDETDVMPGKYYLGDRSEFGRPRPIIFMKLDESYDTNTINIINLNTHRDKIHEIEVFNKDDKIEYSTVPEYAFLNDGDIEHGTSVSNGNFSLLLDDYYNLKDIKLLVHYDASNYYPSYFTIEFVNENGPSKSALIRWDINSDDPYTQWLEFKVGDEYINFLLENNILSEEYAYTNTLRVVYEYDFPLYRHYALEKVFYTYSFSDELDGYEYDASEDIVLYKVYSKENMEPETIQENKIVSTDKDISEDSFIYHVIPVNDENIDIISDTNEKQNENPTSDVEIENKKIIEQKPNKKDLFKTLVIIVISICLILSIYQLIRLLYDKFTGKY